MADFLSEFTVKFVIQIHQFLNHSILQEMYNQIETNDEGEISMKLVTEHIKAVEAGSGNNLWVEQ